MLGLCRLLALLLLTSFALTAKAETPRAPKPADRILAQLYDADDPTVLVAAHRGDWRNAPENSLPAIENAIAMGVDIIEIDVRPTSDGRFVLMHDATLDRTTTGSGDVAAHTLAEVRQLRLRNGCAVPTESDVPTFDEALKIIQGRALVYVDKSEHHIPAIHAIAEQCGMARYVLFYGHRTRHELRDAIGELESRIHYLPKLADETAEPTKYLSDFNVRKMTPVVVTSFATEESQVLAYFAAIRKDGRRIWASPLWPELCAGHTDDRAVDEPDAAWGWHIDRGASVLCTDRPAQLIEYLRNRGLHD